MLNRRSNMKIMPLPLLVLFLSLLSSCEKDTGTIDPGNDPNFTIVAHNDEGLRKFNRKVVVFGIDIYAVAEVDDDRLLHAANVMAQYLDNDEDGIPDNPAVVEQMVEGKAMLVMWKKQKDLRSLSVPDGREAQDLGNDETHPAFVANGNTGPFDASLEEVLHLITHAGYAPLYPSVFGEQAGSSVAEAMDVARGGQFTSIPSNYPQQAWYTYTDRTCSYDCQVAEYHYWALTSILGAQANRADEIGQEWRLETREKVEVQDSLVFALLTDPQYGFPMVLPDGTYRR